MRSPAVTLLWLVVLASARSAVGPVRCWTVVVIVSVLLAGTGSLVVL
jgi:hypothetical protein